MDLELTKAEEKAMKILWSIKKGLIRDIVAKYEEPKPAYTTVATIMKILEKKGFVGRQPIANSHEYYPLIERTEYTNGFIRSFMNRYFSNSFKSMVSEFSSESNLSTEEMEELIEHFKKKIESKNKK
ncbi:BlaI/MecI/CopY family transcriptional regulator [Leptobacterium flavescens]|uniref:BlaI/MecI/CopY family transcriptional regulator n=1 Tax=Leptobacterium flavescens TaxID=472055 RepID=A0A6P0UFN1_9FLAO|nr:BlaI/MecI/CopY family transcriptional regulator [Leptobacterium flavescens]NER12045.1 BlaI/MecI/CopY family transcriptional regulator [Leptobacterium flavescens]